MSPIRYAVMFLLKRVVVRDKFVHVGIGYLRHRLAEEGYGNLEALTKSACYSIMHEAMRLSSVRESDQMPRWGAVFEELDGFVRIILEAEKNPAYCPQSMGRIENILRYHHLI